MQSPLFSHLSWIFVPYTSTDFNGQGKNYSALHNALQHEFFQIILDYICSRPEMSQPSAFEHPTKWTLSGIGLSVTSQVPLHKTQPIWFTAKLILIDPLCKCSIQPLCLLYWNKQVPSLVKPVCTGTDINKVAERYIREVGLSIWV